MPHVFKGDVNRRKMLHKNRFSVIKSDLTPMLIRIYGFISD